MNDYITPRGRSASFVLQDSTHKVLEKVYGREKCDKPFEPKNSPQGFPSGYPAYELITVNGATEMIEHRRMEPIFYVSDDTNVRNEYASTGCK